MDRQDYKSKANTLLNQSTYRSIPQDPTNTIKNKLITILKRVKSQTGLSNQTYKAMYPTGCVLPKFYGLPKIQKLDIPLRPIVSSCGSVTYGVAKELAKILKPLVGRSPYHIKSTQDFVEQVIHITLAPGECLSSYDVSALSHQSHQTQPSRSYRVYWKRTTPSRTGQLWVLMTLSSYWSYCLKTTYFSFQDHFFEQVEGAAMGSPVSPIVANLYMEDLEQKALSTTTPPLASGAGLWMTPLSFTRRSTNKTSYNTLTVLTLPLSLQWRTTRGLVHPLLGHHCQTRV